MFNSLTREHLNLIIDIQLQRVGKLLQDRGIRMELTEAARELLMKGYDPQYGAPGPCAARSSGSSRIR